MTLYIIIATVAFIAVNLSIAVFLQRRTDSESFISSAGSVGVFPLALSISGTVIGGGMFFAISQMGYDSGNAFLALPAAYVVGYFLLARLLPRAMELLRESGGHTLYDLLEYRLGSGQRRWRELFLKLVAGTNLLIYFFSLAGQFVVLADFFQVAVDFSKINAWLMSLVVVGVTTVVYSVFGGVRKDIATDIFQVTLVTVGLVIIAYPLVRAGSTPYQALPPEFFNLTGMGIAFPIGVIAFFSLIFVGRYDYWQRMIAARGLSHAKRALWWSLPLSVIAYVVFGALGMYARGAGVATTGSVAATTALQALLPSGLYLFVIIAMYGAVMSSADTLLNVSGLSVAELRGRLRSQSLGNRERLRTVRLSVLFVGVAASLVYFAIPDIVDLLVGAFSALTILSPCVIYVLFSRRPSATVSSVALIASLTVFLALFLMLPSLRSVAFIAGTLIAVVVIGVGQLIVRRRFRAGSSADEGR